MKKILIVLIISIQLVNAKSITVFYTNDEHGALLPKDYVYDKIRDNSMATITTLIKKYRSQYPNSILLSGGDTFQGNPAAFYYHYIDSSRKNYPLLEAMNYLEYDALAVGNHDVEQGVPFLRKLEKQARFPFLSANAFYIGTDSTAFKPYIIKDIDDVKIAILGLTTPGIPLWLESDLYENIEFRDMVESSRFWLEKIKVEHNPDVIIGLFHSGLNEEWDKKYCQQKNIPLANASLIVAKECQDFDLIITGHSHRLVNDEVNEEFDDKTVSNIVGKVKLTQAKAYCQFLGACHIQLSENSGTYEVDTISIETITTKEIKPDQEFTRLFADVTKDLDQYMNDTLTLLTIENYSAPGITQDLALTDLIHQAQLSASNADLSIASNFSPYQCLKSGPVTVSDIYQLYKYENTLVTTELTGKQIKSYLEYNARYYNKIATSQTNLTYSETINNDIRSYNFDTFAGLNYSIDITKPIDSRITIDSLSNGKPFSLEETYTIAMNSYRYNGGGGFLAALDLKSLPKKNESSLFIRDIIIDYLKKDKNTNVEADNNWKILPENLKWSK